MKKDASKANPLCARRLRLPALLLVALLGLGGCARSRSLGPDQMLAFAAAGEVRPSAGNQSLFVSGVPDLFHELTPFIANRDLVMADLAGGLEFNCDPPPGEPLRWQPGWLSALSAANIRILNLADDHSLDCGRPALTEAVSFLLRQDFYLAGVGPDQEMARAPVYLTRNGITIAIAGYLLAPPPNSAACADCPGPALYDRDSLIAALTEMKSRASRRIVVLHFVERDSPNLTPEELAIVREAIDYGADLVLGYGPVEAGGIQRIRGRWVIGSLGRLAGDADGGINRADGLLVSAEFTADKMMNLRLLPLAIVGGRPRLLRGEEAAATLTAIVGASPSEVQDNATLIGDILYLK